MMIGFGIDLAGYTTGNTSLAAIEIEGHTANATLLRDSALTVTRNTGDALKNVLVQEAAVLRRCLAVGPVAVDIPIDLQGLPRPAAPRQIWELTLRPIDNELRAMPPFADRIGAPVARFTAIMRCAKLPNGTLGEDLFETYPKAIWQKMGINPGTYKNRRKEKVKERKKACKALCEKLGIEPHLENDDDIDAIICAITAVAPKDHLCQASDYETEVQRLPTGFRLLKRNPFKKIRLQEKQFVNWIVNREKQK